MSTEDEKAKENSSMVFGCLGIGLLIILGCWLLTGAASGDYNSAGKTAGSIVENIAGVLIGAVIIVGIMMLASRK